MSRTLLERVRAMLQDANRPEMLWSEAIYVASIFRKCVPSAGLEKSPQERSLGKKPDVSHLRVFGCKASVHLHVEKRDKLDSVTVEGTFSRDAAQSKAWRVLVPEGTRSWKIMVSSDVCFVEDIPGTLPRILRPKNTANAPQHERGDDTVQ